MPLAELALALLLSTRTTPSSVPSNLEVTRGITFATRDRIELQLDVLRSKTPTIAPAPAVLFLHGGAWRDGRRDAPNPVQNELAMRGFVCLQADYRLSQESLFPAQLHDVRAALRWVRDNADAWNIDATQIGVWGMSAGGHLALLAGYSGNALAEPDTTPVAVRAVAAVMPTTDVLSIYKFRLNQKNVRADLVGAASPETQLLGGNPEQNVELARAASPISYVTPSSPPTLLVHGVQDETVPARQSQSLAQILHRNKVRHQLVLLAGLGHEAKWEAYQDPVVTFFLRELGTPIR